eukprot:133331-Hanusia_phi.AAC.1
MRRGKKREEERTEGERSGGRGWKLDESGKGRKPFQNDRHGTEQKETWDEDEDEVEVEDEDEDEDEVEVEVEDEDEDE